MYAPFGFGADVSVFVFFGFAGAVTGVCVRWCLFLHKGELLDWTFNRRPRVALWACTRDNGGLSYRSIVLYAAMVRAALSLTHGARRANFPQRKKITAVAYIFANEVLVFWLLNFRTLSGRSPTTLSRTCQAPPYVARVPATAAVGVGALKKTLLCDTVANSMGWGLIARA